MLTQKKYHQAMLVPKSKVLKNQTSHREFIDLWPRTTFYLAFPIFDSTLRRRKKSISISLSIAQMWSTFFTIHQINCLHPEMLKLTNPASTSICGAFLDDGIHYGDDELYPQYRLLDFDLPGHEYSLLEKPLLLVSFS